MLMPAGRLVLALAFSQATAYTLMAPKIYGQTLPANSRTWSGVMPYAIRAYQPSLPPQYYGRYYGDPYFGPNMQNPDYFYSQDPYTASFDDSDYYSNYLYYIPSRRLYYDQPLVDAVDDIQDYEDEPDDEDNNFKMQREWWLEKNVMPNEDTDFDRYQFDDFYDYKVPKLAKKPKSKELRMNLNLPKPRYAGIDGFGRKKEKEQVFGSFRLNPRRDDDPVRVYAEPASTQSDDPDVKELKKLYRETGRKDTKIEKHGEPILDDWMRGHVKKSTEATKHKHRSLEQSWPTDKENYELALRQAEDDRAFSMYNEAGEMRLPESMLRDEDKLSIYMPDEPSVYEKIKKLLALEEGSEQKIKINKRVRQSTKSKGSSTKSSTSTTTTSSPTTFYTTIRQFPEFGSQSTSATVSKQIKNHKRSAINSKKPFLKPVYADEESLSEELSALRHQRS